MSLLAARRGVLSSQAVAAIPPVFVSDTFTGTDATTLDSHTGGTGATWTKRFGLTGVMAIASNRLIKQTGATQNCNYSASGTPTTNEYDVEADLYVASLLTGDQAGVYGRANLAATGSGTFYLARYAIATGQWELFKVVNGTSTQLGQFVQALTVGVTYHLKLQIRSAAKKLFVDGVERVTSADDTQTTAGLAGVRATNTTNAQSGATGLQLDNFTATNA